MSQLQTLEEKFRKLTLEESVPSGPFGRNGRTGESSNHLPFEADLKSTIKEIVNINWQEDSNSPARLRLLLSNALKVYKKDATLAIERDLELLSWSDIQDKILTALVVLKVIGEAPLPKHPDLYLNGDAVVVDKIMIDHYWEHIIFPNLSDIYDYLVSTVLHFCEVKRKGLSFKGNEGSGDAPSSAGFAHHQILGLLQKCLRTVLVFLKRGLIANKISGSLEDSESHLQLNKNLNELGWILCGFMNDPVDVGLDIRCNVGLAISYLILYKLKGRKSDTVKFFEEIFKSENHPMKLNGSENEILEIVAQTSSKDVNRIGLAIGIMCSMDLGDPDVDLTDLMFFISKNILDMDHGTKESVNLGSGRVLEMMADKLSNPFTPVRMLEKIAPLLVSFEFFVFSYIPGHIDAVKNCCRNILGSLTRIYARIFSEKLIPNAPDLIEELLRKILAKDVHVKWIGLACVVKNSPLSVKVLELDPFMPISLLCAKRTCQNPANDSYIGLMSYDFERLDCKDWEERWVVPLFLTQPSQNNESNWPQKRTIISIVLNSQRNGVAHQPIVKPLLQFVIKKMKSTQSEQITEAILLAAEITKMSSELGLKVELDPATTKSSKDSFRGLVPRQVLNSWLWNENPQIRLAGFSLLAETKKTSEVILEEDFESLKILLKYSLVSQNPAFRQQFMAYFKKLLQRLKDSQALLRRKKSINDLQNYAKFYVWMWNFLTEEEGLFSGANFGRRCQSLECLSEIVAIFDDLSIFGVEAKNSNFKYLSWLSDSYEANKIRALEILVKMSIPGFQDEATCKNIFEEAISLCENVRPPESVTGRYLMTLLIRKTTLEKFSAFNVLNALLGKLEDIYQMISTTSLTAVSSECPMYGVISCIKMILNSTDDYHTNPEIYGDYFGKLIPLLVKYNAILFPLLGNEAPEGFLPGLPDSSKDNKQVVRSITAQMLLVCSWRSMRDICHLFADMCVLLPLEGELPHPKKTRSGKFILSVDQVVDIGDHMLNLLRNLVHRGVFEQVFVAFKTLATRLWKSSNPKLCGLPSKWLNEAMDEEHMSSKCITRRSAGLPFIFQALLSAESDNSTFLSNWVKRLFIKDESPKFSQLRIHAMNVLRGLFRNANFSKAMMPFVPDGVRIAFRGLKSEFWTERNAGLMLYGAVIRRTFGSKLNLMSAPTFFRRFPQMYDFLIEELDICLARLKSHANKNGSSTCSDNSSEFTFHLLVLLSSFAPAGRVEDQHFSLCEFIPKLRQCATSPDGEVRKLAAKAIIPFLNSPSDTSLALKIIKEIKQMDLSEASLNHLHGNFIQIAGIVKYVNKNTSILPVILALDELLVQDFFSKIKCPTVFEVISDVILAFEDYSDPLLQKLFKSLLIAYHKIFNNSNILYRNMIPGLSVADSKIARGEVLFKISAVESQNDIFFKVIYDFLTNYQNESVLEQLLEHLCDKSSKHLIDIFNSDLELHTPILLDVLISCYLIVNNKYVGQSVMELKFLDFFTRITPESYNSWLSSKETDSNIVGRLLDRIFAICMGSSSTNEHKRFAVIVLSNLTFWTDISMTQEQRRQVCETLLEWTDFSIDDDLRFGAALSVPLIPFNLPPTFSVVDQCKIWLTIFKLAQDDDTEVRYIINSKITEKTFCDRKSLEKLVAVYFEKMIKTYPLEGLVLLIGLLLRDDFEIKMEEADDNVEERLFDKSEMNMFYEPTTLAKTIKEYLHRTGQTKTFKSYFEISLPIELSELYEIASNTSLFICSPTLASIINIVKMRLNCDETEDKEDHPSGSFCIPTISLKNKVQSTILTLIDETFL